MEQLFCSCVWELKPASLIAGRVRSTLCNYLIFGFSYANEEDPTPLTLYLALTPILGDCNCPPSQAAQLNSNSLSCGAKKAIGGTQDLRSRANSQVCQVLRP